MIRQSLALAFGTAMLLGTPALGNGWQAAPSAGMPLTPPPPTRSAINDPNSFAAKDYELRNLGKNAEAFSSAQAIAQCFIRKAKGKAGDFLGGEMTDDPGFKHLQSALAGKYDGCVSASATNIRMPDLDGAVAEELLRAENPSLADHSAAADLVAAKSFYTAPSGLTVTTLGRCLAAYSPGLAYKVLTSATGSESERQTLQALYTATPECGTVMPADIPVAQQRSALASGLYHWLHKG